MRCLASQGQNLCVQTVVFALRHDVLACCEIITASGVRASAVAKRTALLADFGTGTTLGAKHFCVLIFSETPIHRVIGFGLIVHCDLPICRIRSLRMHQDLQSRPLPPPVTSICKLPLMLQPPPVDLPVFLAPCACPLRDRKARCGCRRSLHPLLRGRRENEGVSQSA